MRTSVNTSSNLPFNTLWAYIDSLSDTAKLELIGELSNSLLHANDPSKGTDKKQKILSLAGAWNADARSASMDDAAMSSRNHKITRKFNFDD